MQQQARSAQRKQLPFVRNPEVVNHQRAGTSMAGPVDNGLLQKINWLLFNMGNGVRLVITLKLVGIN